MPRLVEVRSRHNVRARVRSRRTRYAAGVERGIRKATAFLLRESLRLVPVDTGALRASARTRFEGEGLQTEGWVSYNTHYAIYVHEDLHARHAPGKTAKYLERPAREQAAEIRRIVREECVREAQQQ